MEEVTREEFSHLAARVSVVEREVEGEKLVTRYILEQTRRNGDDLAAIKGRLGRVESRLDGVEGRLGRVESRLDGVESRLDGVERKLGGLDQTVKDLAKSLPTIIGDVVREVWRERSER
jgi:archaellum component FlaC